MATVRPLATILALIANNSSRNISGLDMQDALVSVFGPVAAIYVADGSTAQTGITTTPELMTGFAADGLGVDAVPDHTIDGITINTDGNYFLFFQCSFTGTVTTKFEFHFCVDGAEQPYGCHDKVNAGGDVGSASAFGPLTLSATEVVTMYVESDKGGGADLTPVDASLIVLKIG